MRKTALMKHDAAKFAAQYLLKNGLASVAEVTALCGRSRQIVGHWARQLDADTVRQEHLAKIFNQAQSNLTLTKRNQRP